MAELVVGVAEARPKGFSSLMPQRSMLMSTWSTAVKKVGRRGSEGMKRPCSDCREGGRQGERQGGEDVCHYL